MQARVDRVIAKVRDYHRRYFEEGDGTRDVLIVAHGHFNRVLIARWVEFPICLGEQPISSPFICPAADRDYLGTHFNVEPGSVGVLSYNHRSLKEPALNALNLYADIL